MKIFLSEGDMLFFEEMEKGDVEINLNIPKDVEEVIEKFRSLQELLDFDQGVSLEILMAEIFRVRPNK